MHVRLIREIDAPGRSGPINGMFALQQALRDARPAWLHVGGRLRGNELPWYWHWGDGPEAARRALAGKPFVCGPNILFGNSRRPCATRTEVSICRAASCRLLFTESEWYGRLIERHRGPANRAPIVLWPYPIVPVPGGPLQPAKYDLLIYVKNGRFPGLVDEVSALWRRHRVVYYGRYRRQRMWEIARRSRACLYLADDDRGPLALAEILLSGCPTIGLPTGAPFVRHGQTGIVLDRLTTEACFQAIRRCHALDRRQVARLAAAQFDGAKIVETILAALDGARGVGT
jgi:hypothetical protein